jgi:hypothetical protein
MPIDYSKYPENWLTEIRPRIMKRAENKCENCGFENGEFVYAVRYKGRTTGWYRDYFEALKQKRSMESKKDPETGRLTLKPNPKLVKVILTVAHLDHDETNMVVNDERLKANELWKAKMLELKALGKEQESDCIKTWLRSQYGETIRERKRNATPGDFDIIGTAFHKWLRENGNNIGIKRSADYSDLVQKEFILFSNTYIRIAEYSAKLTEGFEYIFYNADRNFTLQPLILLASLDKNDTKDIIDSKLKIVSCFLDQYISIRIFNYKSLDYSAMTYAMFMMAKKIRQKSSIELVEILTNEITTMEFNLDGIIRFDLNGWTKRYMLHQLARITHFVEEQSGKDTKFDVYVNRSIKNPYDIEHIWVDHFDRYSEEFESEEEFQRTRNMFGDLVLLPQDINRSLNDSAYSKKLPKYFGQNLLASSLNENCYENNPNFLRFANANNLKFNPSNDFTKETIKERQTLYLEIAKLIWNTDNLQKYVI